MTYVGLVRAIDCQTIEQPFEQETKILTKTNHFFFIGVIGFLASAACQASSHHGDSVWAINVGGPAYVASDGTKYDAEESIWTPERIDVFVDDELYFTYVNEGKGWQEWPHDQPFHLVLNLAIGGAWGRAGGGIDDSQFPQRMLIDYVRVYQARD